MPVEDEERSVLNAVYEHFRWIREEQSAFYNVHQQKLYRLMTVQMLLFAGMSYAITHAGWALSGPGAHWWVLGSSGVLAALLLFMAFLGCISCIAISDVPILGVEALGSLVKDGQVKKLRTVDLHGDLSQNIKNAVRQERDGQDKQKFWTPLINTGTIAGAVAVAFFVTYAMVGNVMVQRTTQEKAKMPEQTNEVDSNTSDQTDADGSQSGDAANARPSAVEPSETSQRSAAPSQAKVTETRDKESP